MCVLVSDVSICPCVFVFVRLSLRVFVLIYKHMCVFKCEMHLYVFGNGQNILLILLIISQNSETCIREQNGKDGSTKRGSHQVLTPVAPAEVVFSSC